LGERNYHFGIESRTGIARRARRPKLRLPGRLP
jgi:hypothetical protein